MGSAVERTDEHVREYLIYRGFTSALKHLDSEIKADKEKGFRVGRLGRTGILVCVCVRVCLCSPCGVRVCARACRWTRSSISCSSWCRATTCAA